MLGGLCFQTHLRLLAESATLSGFEQQVSPPLIPPQIRCCFGFVEYRVQPGIECVEYFVGLKDPVSFVFVVGPQDVQGDQVFDGVVGGREGDGEAFGGFAGGNHRLADQQVGDFPDGGVFSALFGFQPLVPAVADCG